MAIFKKNGNWYIDYYFKGKRKRECIGPNKKKAEQSLAVRKASIVQGRYNLEQEQPNVMFEDLAQLYLEYSRVNKRSYVRDECSMKHLLKYFKGRTLAGITPLLIESYKNQRIEEVKGTTVNRELECLRHMFNMAIKWEKAATNPVSKVRFFKQQNKSLRVLSGEEEEKLLDACSDHLKSIVITALNTGMRKGEVLGLTWDRVDLAKRAIVVEGTKTGEIRHIPINLFLTEKLKNVKKNGRYAFSKEDGTPYGDIKTGFWAAVRRSKIAHCRFHDLRHTFATRLVMKGVDLVTVKELLGHKSIRSTMIYAHPTPEHKKWAVEQLQKDSDGHYLDTKGRS